MNQACPLCEPQKFDADLERVPTIAWCEEHSDLPSLELRAAVEEYNALKMRDRALSLAAAKFMAKVEAGLARSRESYSEFKAALQLPRK